MPCTLSHRLHPFITLLAGWYQIWYLVSLSCCYFFMSCYLGVLIISELRAKSQGGLRIYNNTISKESATGSKHSNADSLSRRPCSTDGCRHCAQIDSHETSAKQNDSSAEHHTKNCIQPPQLAVLHLCNTVDRLNFLLFF